MQQTRAIFLDRDGVLLEDDHNLISSISSVKIFPFVGDAISILRKLNFKIFLITNQTVVSRGILSYEKMLELNQEILALISKQNPNSLFDDIYICPHHPNANVDEYRIDCDCRKPKPGMIIKAQKQYNLSLENSIVIGDRLTDIYSGKSVGCKGILIKEPSKELQPLIETTIQLNPQWLSPDYSFSNLYEAAIFIKDHL